MSLRLIYGKSGSGKSRFCFEEIKKKIKEGNKIYMITPEQFSFTAEQKLMEVMQKESVMAAEVLTFERMAYRVLSEVRRQYRGTFIFSRKIDAYFSFAKTK